MSCGINAATGTFRTMKTKIKICIDEMMKTYLISCHTSVDKIDYVLYYTK